ncbi:MAG: glycoside hydrolase family 6 protein [Micromonosporaceae bacterium]
MRFSPLTAARRSRLGRRLVVAGAALALGFGLVAVASTQANAATSCSASYATQSQWQGGFVANMTVTNTGTTALTSWTVTFAFPGDQHVTNFWNTSLTQSGENVTATNVSYNGNVAAGASTSFGFQGTWTNSDATPASITCNGGGSSGGSPTVSLTSPANGATFTAPATINLTATASESGGSIASVQFLNGSTVIGTVTTSPYSFTWTNVGAGTYTLTARATDGSGNTATSSAVTVTVSGTSTPTIVATPTSLAVTQGQTGTFGVTLNQAPTSNVTVTVSRTSGNTGLSVSSGGSLTFTPSNWNTAQNVTIAADSSSTGSATFTASSPGYTSATVTVTEQSGNSGGGHVADPYSGASTYKNPDFVSEVNTQAAADGNNAAERAVGNYQTAIWMDRIAAITGDSTHMGLQAQLDNAETQVQGSTPLVFEVVIYDLPGRDCAALASNGEIPATSAGLTQYETQYIDPITSILAMPKYSNLRIVAIIEPDSLPNVVTNQSLSACQTATPFYEQGIEYALNKLHAISNVYNYMDIAHSAWLGWPSNMSATPAVYNTVVNATTAKYASIDGFISDTANYTPTQEPLLTNPNLSIGGQPVMSANFYQYNPTFDELTYDTQMYQTLQNAGFPASKKFLIDTSRNGWGPTHPTTITQASDVNTYVADNKIDKRPFRGDWCNQNNAGIGARPADQPFGASSPIEAFVWIKPPGESDGDYPSGSHTHGDPHCDPNGTNTDGNGNTYSTGSIPGFDVPAGQWFPAEFQMLVRNAFPSL